VPANAGTNAGETHGKLIGLTLLLVPPSTPKVERANELMQPVREEARRVLTAGGNELRGLNRCEKLLEQAIVDHEDEYGDPGLRAWVVNHRAALLRARERYGGR